MVGRSSPTSDSASSAMHEDEADPALLGPIGDGELRRVKHERGRHRPRILGGIGVAEHDLEGVSRLGKALLDLRQLDDLIEDLHSMLEVGNLLEERDRIECGDILLVGEGETAELVDGRDIVCALGERDDVTARGTQAPLALYGADGAEGIEDFARHGLEFSPLAAGTMRTDVIQGTGMHERMLAEFHLGEVEAESLDQPDKILERTVGSTRRSGIDERALDHVQVVEQVFGMRIHEVRRAGDRCLQAVGDDEHDRTVGLACRYLECLRGEDLAHLDLMVPQVHEGIARRRGTALEGQRTAHLLGALGKHREGMLAELLSHLAADLGGHVGVAVPVGADPAACAEEGWDDRLHTTGLSAEQGIVEAPIHVDDHREKRVVEDRDERLGLLDRRRALEGDGIGAEERVDLLEHLALVVKGIHAAASIVLGEKRCDPADLALDCPAARLGGMRREDGMELETGKEPPGLLLPAVLDEAAVGADEPIGGNSPGRQHLLLAFAQRIDAIALLGDIRQMEIRREGTGQQLRLAIGKTPDQRNGTPEMGVDLRSVSCGVDALHAVEQLVEGGAQVLVVLAEHAPHQA